MAIVAQGIEAECRIGGVGYAVRGGAEMHAVERRICDAGVVGKGGVERVPCESWGPSIRLLSAPTCPAAQALRRLRALQVRTAGIEIDSRDSH